MIKIIEIELVIIIDLITLNEDVTQKTYFVCTNSDILTAVQRRHIFFTETIQDVDSYSTVSVKYQPANKNNNQMEISYALLELITQVK